MLQQFRVSTNEIYYEAFLKVPVLNGCTIGATTAPFLEHPFIAFYQQKASKNEMLKQFGVSANEISQESLLKVPLLNRSFPVAHYS